MLKNPEIAFLVSHWDKHKVQGSYDLFLGISSGQQSVSEKEIMIASNLTFVHCIPDTNTMKHELSFPTTFSFCVPFCSCMFFHYIYIPFLLFFFFSLASLFFSHAFCSSLYTCAFLVKLLCSPLPQSCQPFVLHLTVPSISTSC